jgi:dinuclear metal center YbgI/SA1388 family protein
MIELADLVHFLEQFAPLRLAEDWDNVGLLVGRRNQPIQKVMSCLTITPDVACEAIDHQVDLIVSHHPLPFKPIRQLTSETTAGAILLDLIRNDIAVFSAHTAFDSAREGINQSLARGLQMRGIDSMVPENGAGSGKRLGSGRWGWLDDDMTLGELIDRVKNFLGISRLQWVGDRTQSVRTVGVACGAADEFLDVASRLGIDAMIIGETRYHTCIEAEASEIGLIMPGHHASELFAMTRLAEIISRRFPKLDCRASETEHDPIQWHGK